MISIAVHSRRAMAYVKRITIVNLGSSGTPRLFLPTTARRSSTTTDTSISPGQINVELFQYAICPFCNRVKVFLDYAGIAFTPIEVNPLTKAEIKWSKDYRKVPIAKVNDVPYTGSDNIITGLLQQPVIVTNLTTRWGHKTTERIEDMSEFMTISTFAQSPTAVQWMDYATEELAPLLYPNICRTWSDAYSAFAYVDQVETFQPWQRMTIRGIGSFAMYMAASKIKRRRNITDERQALDDALNHLVLVGLADHKKYLSGASEPNLGDLYVFGTLRAIRLMPTLHQQIIFDSRHGDDTGRLRDWYQRMTDKVARYVE